MKCLFLALHKTYDRNFPHLTTLLWIFPLACDGHTISKLRCDGVGSQIYPAETDTRYFGNPGPWPPKRDLTHRWFSRQFFFDLCLPMWTSSSPPLKNCHWVFLSLFCGLRNNILPIWILVAHKMLNLPIKMDLDSLSDSPQALNHIPRTDDWDWVTVRQDPLRDFDTVKSSHELFRSHLNDFQDILYGKKCLVLQDPENKTKIWGSLANDFISLNLGRKGPRVVGQSEEIQDFALPDWIKTVQGLKNGMFNPCESDSGDVVYRGDLNSCQVEISTREMEVLNTFSRGNSKIPSISDRQMELELRRALLMSSQQFARQVRGKIPWACAIPQKVISLLIITDSCNRFLDFNTDLEKSCKDLEFDIQLEIEQSKSTNKLPSKPPLNGHHENFAPNDDVVDLTQESRRSLTNDRQSSEPNDDNTTVPSNSERTQNSETSMGNSLQSSPRRVVNRDENLTVPSHPSQIDPLNTKLESTPEVYNTITSNGDRVSSTPRSQRSCTPSSTRERHIKRSEMEKGQAVPFVQDLLSQGLNFDQIRERYKVKFGIWRTVASLASYHSQHKHKHLVLKISPSRLRELLLKTPAHDCI